MAKDMIEGLKFMHTKDVLHLDLKPSNILVTRHYDIKIADFGLSQKVTANILPQIVGTPLYMAPEIYKTQEVSPSADVYSYGLILYALFLEQEPFYNFKGLSYEEFWDNKIKFELNFEVKKGDVEKKKISHEMKTLIQNLCNAEPGERPKFNDIDLDRVMSGDTKFRKIWETHFKDRNRVHLIDFILKFYEDYEMKPMPLETVQDDVTYKCFRLVMNMQSEIAREDIERFISLFSPLESKAHLIISKVKDLLERPYFWGYMTENDAANILKKGSKHNNTFLIRYSANTSNFVVSYTTNKGKKVDHYRFQYKEFDRITGEMNKFSFHTPSSSKGLKQYPFCELFKKTNSKLTDELAKPEFLHITNLYKDQLTKSQSSGFKTVQEKLDKNTKKKIY